MGERQYPLLERIESPAAMRELGPAQLQQLADELGSVREILSRLLKGFAAQGLVSLGREQIVVSDRDGLKSIAAV